MKKYEFGIKKIFQKESTDVILVQGDTKSILAGALAAVKLHIKVEHIEADLKRFNPNSKEWYHVNKGVLW